MRCDAASVHRTAGQPSRSRIGQAGSHSDAANEAKDKEAFIVNTLEAILPTIRHVAERGGDVGNVPNKYAIRITRGRVRFVGEVAGFGLGAQLQSLHSAVL